MATQSKAAKQVQIIARIEFKADPRKVVYQMRSSNGKNIYHTFLFDGKATGCECPAKGGCYHRDGAEAEEAKRRVQAQAEAVAQAAQAAAPASDERHREHMPLNGNRAFSILK